MRRNLVASLLSLLCSSRHPRRKKVQTIIKSPPPVEGERTRRFDENLFVRGRVNSRKSRDQRKRVFFFKSHISNSRADNYISLTRCSFARFFSSVPPVLQSQSAAIPPHFYYFFSISRNDLARPDNRIPLVVTRFFPTNDSTNKSALAVEQGL